MLVCDAVQERLTKTWDKLSRRVHELRGQISQIDLDEQTASVLDALVDTFIRQHRPLGPKELSPCGFNIDIEDAERVELATELARDNFMGYTVVDTPTRKGTIVLTMVYVAGEREKRTFVGIGRANDESPWRHLIERMD